MRYGIDIDGVLANFGAQVVRVGNQLWPGKFPPNYRPDNWDYEGYLTKTEWKQVWGVIDITPHFWEDLEEEPGAVELLRALSIYHRSIHDEVYFITARRTTIGDSPLVQSAAWLNRKGLWPRRGFSTIIPVAEPKNKAELFRGLGLKFFLDDYAPTVAELNTLDGVQAYVLDQPWNRYATELPRVYSVAEYIEIIHAHT